MSDSNPPVVEALDFFFSTHSAASTAATAAPFITLSALRSRANAASLIFSSAFSVSNFASAFTRFVRSPTSRSRF